MAVLGLCSATRTISVGLVHNGQVLSSLSVSGKEAFTEDLVTYIDRIVKEANVGISAVAVASGPGSYNGLRGGIATAKTLAQSLSLPIIEVGTLEAVAYGAICKQGIIIAQTDARRDEYNFALFASDGKELKRLTRDLVLKEEKISALLSKIKGEIHIAEPLELGANTALLGERLLKEGKTSDLMKITPKYSVEPKIREFLPLRQPVQP